MIQLRKESRRTLTPDQLGSYIKVSRPSVWMLMAVIAALLVAGVVWFFAGSVKEGASGPCRVREGSCIVYIPLSKSAKLQPGNEVVLTDGDARYQGTVSSVGDTPLSIRAIEQECTDLDLSTFAEDGWGVAVWIETDAAPGTYAARIITASYQPIRLLFGLED